MIDKHAFWVGYALGFVIAICVAAWMISPAKADYQLPPEVTPALRNACEGDFRKLCTVTGKLPIKVEVWNCIQSTWHRITKRCQAELKVAGLAP